MAKVAKVDLRISSRRILMIIADVFSSWRGKVGKRYAQDLHRAIDAIHKRGEARGLLF